MSHGTQLQKNTMGPPRGSVLFVDSRQTTPDSTAQILDKEEKNGNVSSQEFMQVFVRIRPFMPKDNEVQKEQASKRVRKKSYIPGKRTTDGQTTGLIQSDGGKNLIRAKAKEFYFDKIFDDSKTDVDDFGETVAASSSSSSAGRNCSAPIVGQEKMLKK